MTSTITPVLKPGTIYYDAALGEFLCDRDAGTTALYTGKTIGGQKLRPIDARDVAEWATYGMGPITCTCGAQQAGPVSVRAAQATARAAVLADLPPVQGALLGEHGEIQDGLF